MSTSTGTITGVPIVCAYVDDLPQAQRFYEDLLGLKDPSPMGANACYYQVTDALGVYVEQVKRRVETDPSTTRASFVLGTPSASALFNAMREAGVKLHHANPVDMGGGQFWFLLSDPSGNVIEILGGQ